MKRNHVSRLALESLEDRNCPAPLNLFFDGLGNLTISGQIDPLVGLDITSTAPNTFDITDGGVPVMLGAVVTGNISIFSANPSDDVVSVTLIGGGINGDLNINLGGQGLFGDSVTIFDVVGTNPIGGNLNLTGANTILNAADVGGNILINNSQANALNTATLTGLTVGGNITYLGGNDLDTLSVSSFVGGSVLANFQNAGAGSNDFTLTGGFSIGGNLTVISGNDGTDGIIIGGTVGRNVSLSLGGGINNFDFTGGAFIGGSLSYIGGLGDDAIDTFTGTLGGNAFFSLGDGNNELDMDGTIGGSSVSIRTGLGNDTVTYSMAGNRARVFASLSLGDDSFTLDTLASGTSVGFLFIDFGFGMDTFDNMFGAPFSFPAILRNLP